MRRGGAWSPPTQTVAHVTVTLELSTEGQGDVCDVTSDVARVVADSSLTHGIATIFIVGSTAAVTTIEFEPGAVADLGRALEQIAPRHADYQHHLQWGDDNGSSHVRAALLGPSLTVPFTEGILTLGTWQQIVVVELDTRSRQRSYVVQLMGE